MQEAMTDPAAFQQKMQERAMNQVAAVQASMATATAPKPDPADEIAKLADLRDRGVLTNAEFQAQKKKVLGT